jgi:phosphate/sulfate permease
LILARGLVLSGFLSQIVFAFIVSPILVAVTAHLLDLITLIIFREQYKP